MKRLIVIGNSHAAAFKDGWPAIAADHPDWTVDFFAAPTPQFRRLRLFGGRDFGLPPRLRKRRPALRRLVARINGRAFIDLAEADVVLRVGVTRASNELLAFLRDREIDGLTEASAAATVSRPVFDAYCDDLAARTLPSAEWLGWDRPHLILHPRPVPAEAIEAAGGPAHADWAALAQRPDRAGAIAAFLDRQAAVFAASGVGLLPPPPATLTSSGQSRAAFTLESRRLRSGEPPRNDRGFMNAAYGAAALTSLFRMLEAPQPTSAASPPPRPASPSARLAPRARWRTGVSGRSPLDPGDLFRPKFPVTPDMRVVTAGGSFAGHVGRALRATGFDVIDTEPFPDVAPDRVARACGYRTFSARYGNIYTVRQLVQLLDEAEGRAQPALPVWRRGERFFDAQRPQVEPGGFGSEDEAARSRARHLLQVRAAFEQADLFVFAFGRTEAWVHRETGTVYPTRPGQIAGEFSPDVFAFTNYDQRQIVEDFQLFYGHMHRINPDMRFVVSVSPAPLAETGGGDHVEVASCYSKSVLRAACGTLAARHSAIDYFPAYEVITSQGARGAYYEPDQRNVSPQGIAAAMRLFLSAHGLSGRSAPRRRGRRARREPEPDIASAEIPPASSRQDP